MIYETPICYNCQFLIRISGDPLKCEKYKKIPLSVYENVKCKYYKKATKEKQKYNDSLWNNK